VFALHMSAFEGKADIPSLIEIYFNRCDLLWAGNETANWRLL